MDVQIRLAGNRDVGPAAQLMIAARHAAVPAIPAPVHSDAAIHEWFTTFVVAEQDVWVAGSDSELDAVMVLTPGWIEQLYVHPSKTGWGIGSVFVDHAKSRSNGELALWTFASNAGAQRFYERHGFSEIDRTLGDNEEGAPDIEYRWRRVEPR